MNSSVTNESQQTIHIKLGMHMHTNIFLGFYSVKIEDTALIIPS